MYGKFVFFVDNAETIEQIIHRFPIALRDRYTKSRSDDFLRMKDRSNSPRLRYTKNDIRSKEVNFSVTQAYRLKYPTCYVKHVRVNGSLSV